MPARRRSRRSSQALWAAVLGLRSLGGEAVALGGVGGSRACGLGLGGEALRLGGRFARGGHGGIEGGALVGGLFDRRC
jgi:hypothetical protein